VSYIEGSGGLYRDMMIHDFDMARFLLGEEPFEVHAAASCLVDQSIAAAGDVDTAVVTLRTAGGKLCQISNSRRATYGYDQRIEAHGANGLIVWVISRNKRARAFYEGLGATLLIEQPFEWDGVPLVEAGYAFRDLDSLIDACVRNVDERPSTLH